MRCCGSIGWTLNRRARSRIAVTPLPGSRAHGSKSAAVAKVVQRSPVALWSQQSGERLPCWVSQRTASADTTLKSSAKPSLRDWWMR